jgi:hypothetical protein
MEFYYLLVEFLVTKGEFDFQAEYFVWEQRFLEGKDELVAWGFIISIFG